MMEWEQQQQRRRQEEEEAMNGNCTGGSNGMFVKVMTDDQMETLRKQIAAYATICEQLVEMHKSLTSHPDLPGGGGARLGNLYSDPLTTSAGHRITGRQRWTPTPMQLQILERIFEQGNGTPSKQKIKDITSELSQHGQISETNVYNWFQNRRARSKRKQQVPNNNNYNNAESEVETEVESSSSPNEKRTKAGDNFQLHNNGNHEDNNNNNVYLQNIEPMHSSLDHSNESIRAEVIMMMMKPPSNNDGSSAATAKLSMSYYDTMLSNPRMDQLMGKMELSGGDGYNPYLQTDDYNMTN